MVRYEDDRAREAAAQVLQQRHDLRLDRRIERRRGLVGEQQIRLDQERHGDHHSLAHAARKLVRIGRDPQCASAMPTLESAAIARRCAASRIFRDDAGATRRQMRTDGEQRIQRRHRILEDHGDPGAAIGVHRALVEREQVDAVEHDFAAQAGHVRRQQAHEARGQARLAGARFSDDAENAALADVEVDSAQDMRRAARRRRLECQPADRYQRRS
jgi:hypothetical protein